MRSYVARVTLLLHDDQLRRYERELEQFEVKARNKAEAEEVATAAVAEDWPWVAVLVTVRPGRLEVVA